MAGPTKPSPHIEKRIQKMKESFLPNEPKSGRGEQANSTTSLIDSSKSLLSGSIDGLADETSTLSSNKADGYQELSFFPS